jgi:hypothetical protein
VAERYTTEDLFQEIDGKSFGSYRELEEVVIRLFNEHLQDFPPHYSYRDAITWADRQRWLQPRDGGFAVEMKKVTPA